MPSREEVLDRPGHPIDLFADALSPSALDAPVIAVASDRARDPLGLDHDDAARAQEDVIGVPSGSRQHYVVDEKVVVGQPIEEIRHESFPEDALLDAREARADSGGPYRCRDDDGPEERPPQGQEGGANAEGGEDGQRDRVALEAAARVSPADL